MALEPAQLALDTQGMIGHLLGFPEQSRRAWTLGKQAPFAPLEWARLVVVGMGGSGIAGDVLHLLLGHPVEVCKNPVLPPSLPGDLLVAVSYSGNTQETLQAVACAQERKLPIVALSSGGQLLALAKKHRWPHFTVPGGLPPRAAFGYLALPVLAWLQGDHDATYWEENFAALNALSLRCRPENDELDNPALKLARRLHGKMAICYGTSGVGAVAALRWKCQINENAKQAAFASALPEALHNEIVQYTSAAQLTRCAPEALPIVLRHAGERPDEAAFAEAFGAALDDIGWPWIPVWAQGVSPLERLLALCHLGDWTSVYLALLSSIDPTPVDVISATKSRIARM